MPLAQGLTHLPEVLGLFAAFFAAGWAAKLSQQTFGRIILVLLLTMGVVLLAEAMFALEPVGLAPADAVARFAISTVLGLGGGVVSSLLGVAGGEIIIPILAIVFAIDIKLAGSLSLIISLPVVVVGLGRCIAAGALREPGHLQRTLMPMAAGSIVGALNGGLLVGMVPGDWLKGLLGVALIWSAWKAFHHVSPVAVSTGV
jgi:uncharacterized membrane protein YfcA